MADRFILVTNDDGYDAPGLSALIDAVAPLGRLLVVEIHGCRLRAHRSLRVARPTRTRITVMIQKRTMTFGSPQPFNS